MKFLLIAGLGESLINFRGPLLRALQSVGYEVHVAAPDLPSASPVRAKLESFGVVVHQLGLSRTGTSPLADARTFFELFSLMKKIRPQAVLAYTIKPVIYGMAAAWLAAVPRRFALITGLGYSFLGGAKRRGLLVLVKALYKFSLGKAKKVFFQNPDDQALFVKSGLVKSTTPLCVVNGSGVDLNYFSLVPLPTDCVHFLLIARLLGDKGVREYASACASLRSKYPFAKFGLVGWLDENPDSIRQSELDAWVSSGTLEYFGRLDDVRGAIASCSVYVLPSYREGTPRTVLEAMAMGRPVITTDAPGCRETVVDGQNGFLVPVKSVEALAEAMAKFLDNQELIFLMGRNSRQMAEDKYDVHKVNSEILREMATV